VLVLALVFASEIEEYACEKDDEKKGYEDPDGGFGAG
jgi:hypothetical protein